MHDIMVVFDDPDIEAVSAITQIAAREAVNGQFWFGLSGCLVFSSEKTASELLKEFRQNFGRYIIVEIDSSTLSGNLTGAEWIRINAEVFSHTFPDVLKRLWGRELSKQEIADFLEDKRSEVEAAKQKSKRPKES